MQWEIAQSIAEIGGLIALLIGLIMSYANQKRNSEEAIQLGRENAENLRKLELDVREKYVRTESLRDFKDEILGAIARVTDRLDKVIDRQ